LKKSPSHFTLKESTYSPLPIGVIVGLTSEITNNEDEN
jgi:hypothetical protein